MYSHHTHTHTSIFFIFEMYNLIEEMNIFFLTADDEEKMSQLF